MTAVVPLIAEALNLAITEHWPEVEGLHRFRCMAEDDRETGHDDCAVGHDKDYSEDIEALAVALHARLQEQGTLG